MTSSCRIRFFAAGAVPSAQYRLLQFSGGGKYNLPTHTPAWYVDSQMRQLQTTVTQISLSSLLLVSLTRVTTRDIGATTMWDPMAPFP